MIHIFFFTLLIPLSLVQSPQIEESTFNSNGTKIRYIQSGQGAPVMLLHGFGGAAEMWSKSPFGDVKILSDLARNYRVIALDYRGHGKSDKPHDPKQYGQEIAEDVTRLMDHLRIKKAHIVGYSMGSTVAGSILVSHPDRLLSATFGGGAPTYQPSEEFSNTISATAAALEQEKGVGPLVIALTPAGQSKPSLEQATAMGQLFMVGQDQKALAAVLRGWRDFEVTQAKLNANTIPVAFIYGSREADMLLAGIEKTKKLMSNAKVTVIEGGDHMSTLLRPEFSAAIQKFLTEQGK